MELLGADCNTENSSPKCSNEVNNGISQDDSTTKALEYIKDKKGKEQKLGRLLARKSDVNLLQQSSSGKNLLHYAVLNCSRQRAYNMVEHILKYAESKQITTLLINTQDKNGETPLHSAAKNGRAKIVERLLPLENNFKLRGHDNSTALDFVYRNVPEAVVSDCRHGVDYGKDEEGVCEELVTVDFKKLIRHPSDETNIEKLRETNMLGGLLTEKADRFRVILEHPVVQVFLHLKYEKGYPVIVASIFVQVLWQLIYSYFLFHLYFEACPWKRSFENAEENVTLVTNNDQKEIRCNGSNLDFPGIFLASIVWLLGTSFFIKEAFEYCTVTARRYFTQLENVGQLFGIVSVIWTCWPIYERMSGAELIEIRPWQYNLAAASEFIAWTLILGQICKLQPLRIYIQIFVKVFKSFVLFICTFASLLFGFAAAFCIIMPEANAFRSPWLAVPKVLVMMTGELNYDDVFHGDGVTKISETSHYFTTQLLFSMFTILMSLILLNLLVGLAVTDTQELKENCRTAELSSMLEEIYLLESFAFRLYRVFQFKWLLERLSVSTNWSNPGWLKHSAALDKLICDDDEEGQKESKVNYLITLEFSKATEYPFPTSVMDGLRDICESHKIESEQEEESTSSIA